VNCGEKTFSSLPFPSEILADSLSISKVTYKRSDISTYEFSSFLLALKALATTNIIKPPGGRFRSKNFRHAKGYLLNKPRRKANN